MIKFENFGKNLNESIKIGGVIYFPIKNIDGDIIYVSKVGFLGKDDHVIDWNTMVEEYIKFRDKIKK
jgi:hypothetical protein